MQQLFEIIPIALFFICYKVFNGDIWHFAGFTLEFNGIYTATAVLMIATLIQILLTWLITKTVEKRLLLLAAVVFIMGGLTLSLHNNIFILWKPTLFNWILALAFIITPFIGQKKTLMERMLGQQLTLPTTIWKRLNTLWVINFILVGALNLWVAYQFSEAFWVSYKLYSSIGFTLIISLLTALIVAPHLQDTSSKE